MGLLKRGQKKPESKGERVLENLHPRVQKLMQDGKHSKAEKLLKSALEVDPTDEESWLELALIYTFQKNYKKSIKAFRKSLEINESNPRAWGGLGMALGDSGNKDEAKHAFSKAIELDPDNKTWPFTLAYLYLQDKNLEESAKLYERVVELDPEFGMAWSFLVNIYAALGDTEKQRNAAIKMALLHHEGKL